MPLSELVAKSAGYSGREIEQVCEIAAANMVSRMNPDLIERVEAGLSEIQAYQLKAEPLTNEDFVLGFDTIQPMTSRNVLKNYETWSGNTI
jgi:SpoVK/Ycf46/Vps4 family AAA+-type ATPase